MTPEKQIHTALEMLCEALQNKDIREIHSDNLTYKGHSYSFILKRTDPDKEQS